jgi:hypothetical protein
MFRQWLFILEGLPSVVMGVLLAIFLPEDPVHSSWITEQQKELFKQDVSAAAPALRNAVCSCSAQRLHNEDLFPGQPNPGSFL